MRTLADLGAGGPFGTCDPKAKTINYLYMKRISLFLFITLLAAIPSHAQLSEGISFLVKGAPRNLPRVDTAITRQVFRAARQNLKAPVSMLPAVQRSLVQISLPKYYEGQFTEDLLVYATGFLVSSHGQTWVASAYHVMGGEGRTRVVRLIGNDGKEKEVTVRVGVSGTSGWHEPDVSLAPIKPEDIPEGMVPLEIAEPNLQAPAYSVGYTTGDYSMGDILPVRRKLTNAEGINLYGTYHIDGSTWQQPVTGNGQCGSPIVQQVPGSDEWRVVGLHNGHILDLDEPALSRGSGINLSKAVPYLLDPFFDPSLKIPTRVLSFRGFEVGNLADNERVHEIKLIRNGKEEWAENMQKFPHPYSDAHAELVLGKEHEIMSGDQLVFTVVRRQKDKAKRSKRVLTFTLP